MRNTKALAMLAAAILAAGAGSAQVNPTQPQDGLNYTLGLSNGRMWQTYSTQGKIGYVAGNHECKALLTVELPTAESFRISRASLPAGVLYAEVVQALDRFYDNSVNSRIPISAAINYVAMEMKGATPEALAAYAAKQRRLAAESANGGR